MFREGLKYNTKLTSLLMLNGLLVGILLGHVLLASCQQGQLPCTFTYSTEPWLNTGQDKGAVSGTEGWYCYCRGMVEDQQSRRQARQNSGDRSKQIRVQGQPEQRQAGSEPDRQATNHCKV